MVNLKSKLKQAQKQRGALLVMNLVIIALCLILFWGTIHIRWLAVRNEKGMLWCGEIF